MTTCLVPCSCPVAIVPPEGGMAPCPAGEEGKQRAARDQMRRTFGMPFSPIYIGELEKVYLSYVYL
ncbi:hypothetical protein B0T18DRAFT_398773 [Schizothecium vesticola]|uniref:Uncharacterized protein n=1 Tax=Schizothecium vesticola TaxID=314040 RepID=A0AA40KCT2_9PEZI|nr:hypothetical protein B0T18DRAFT_398773 [Schizothecium vesticola]